MKLPQGALVIPVADADELGLQFQVAFNNLIGILNMHDLLRARVV